MSDYISREEAIESICERLHITRPKSGEDVSASDIRQFAEALILPVPAADVQEVKRGRWEDTMFGWLCTICHDEQQYTKRLKYCPNCGARMEDAE